MLHRKNKQIALFITTALTTPYVLASGYHFGTQAVSVQSTANASSAEAADPGTLFYNAAGLSKLPGTQISANLVVAVPKVNYSNASGNYFDSDAVTGLASGKITDKPSLVPHLYASRTFNDRFSAGLGIYVPFGSKSEYEPNSIMRYSIAGTEIQAINVNPSIAFNFQNGHAVGIGVIGQRLEAGLTKHVDFSKAGQGIATRQAVARQAQQLGVAPTAITNNATVMAQINAGVRRDIPNGSADVIADVKGDDWGFGFNLAWMFDINEKSRIGINYRSKVKHSLSGEAKWLLDGPALRNPTLAAAVRNNGYVASEGASVNIVTPESISLHGMIKANPKLDLFGDITWTKHSRFNAINIDYENTKQTTSGTNPGARTPSNRSIFKPNWQDTYRFSLGGAYQYSNPLQLRFGLSYDQSPVRSANDRLATMPDNDRIWLSLGAKYDFNQNSTLNLAYSYIHIKNASANTTGYCGSSVKAGPSATDCVSDRGDARADYKSNAHFIGLQYTYRF